MLRSGSTARFAWAEAASWRAVARRASSRASLRRTSANAASADAAAARSANPASVARRLRARRRAAASAAVRASEERALAGGQSKVGRARPGLELRQPALARQVLGSACVVPLPDGLDETPVEERCSRRSSIHPCTVPLGQDRLVRDLDRGRARQRLAVEGQDDARRSVRAPRRARRARARAGEARCDAPCAACRSRAHEAKEDLAAGCPRRWAKVCVETFGPAAERADDPTRCEVALERQHVAGAVREQLGERVLQERHGARLVADVGDDLRDEPRLEANADPSCRPLDRLGELVLRRRRNRDHPGAKQSPNSGSRRGWSRKSARSVTSTRAGEWWSAASAVRPARNLRRVSSSAVSVNSSSNWSITSSSSLPGGRIRFTTRRIPSSSRASSSTRSSGRSTATRRSAAASSSYGYEPGNMSVTSHGSVPGSALPRSAGRARP